MKNEHETLKINLVNLVMSKITQDIKIPILKKNISYIKNVYIFSKVFCVYEKNVVSLHDFRKEEQIK